MVVNFNKLTIINIRRFGKSSEQRMISYLENVKIPRDGRILDLGCGNGHFCLELVSFRRFL